MSILIISTAFVLAGILIGLFTTASAPMGYEDESGFHFGNENGQPVSSHDHGDLHLPGASGLTARHA